MLVIVPSVFEFEVAIEKLRGYKPSSIDQIPAELIQQAVGSEIHEIINYVWKKEKLPEQWKESIIVPICKKGDKQTAAIIEAYHSYQLHTKCYQTSCYQG